MTFVPEIILRESVARGLRIFRNKPDAIRALFATESLLFPESTQNPVERFIDFLYEHPAIPTVINYPDRDLNIPNVAIVSPNSAESPENSYVGDMGGLAFILANTDHPGGAAALADDGSKCIATSMILESVDSGTFHIIVTTLDPDLTALLTALVRFSIFHVKLRLEADYGIMDIRLSDSDFQFPKDYWPTLTWSKSIKVTALIRKGMNSAELYDTADEAYWNSVNSTLSEIIVQLQGVVVPLNARFP